MNNQEETQPVTETKLTWEQRKKDYMREYMKKRYYEKLELTREQSKVRSAKYRQAHPERATKMKIENSVNALKGKIAVLKNHLGDEAVKTIITEMVGNA